MFGLKHLAIIATLCTLSMSASAQTKLCIDPGHGGSDSGASGNGQLEKTNVLNTGLRFRNWLNADSGDGAGGGNWNVLMTRSSDTFPSLSARTSYANSNFVERFMSIHNNACCGASGTETYCHTRGGTSADLRNKIQQRSIEAWGLINRGNKTATFYVLTNTNMPSTLAELGFITSAGDAAFLGNSAQQDKMAKFHMYAVQNHFGINAYTPGGAPSPPPPSTIGNRRSVVRTPSGGGYWITAADGGVFTKGNAPFYGSAAGLSLVQPMIGMAARPQGDGYWLAAADGGLFNYGAAAFHGSLGGLTLNQPIVGICPTASGNGYWMVGKDGGIFAFGDAPHHGSLPGLNINVTNVVAMGSTPGNGYWILASDGGVFSFGSAGFHGSAYNQGFNDFTAMAASNNGGGYYLLRSNGAVYAFGNAQYRLGANEPNKFASIATGPSTIDGYWLLKKDGAIFSFGDAVYYGGAM